MSKGLVTVGVLVAAFFIWASGGYLGPVNLNTIPTPFLIFMGVSIAVVFGLSRI